MLVELAFHPSALVDAGRRWSSFDGPVTAQTAQRRPRNDLGSYLVTYRSAMSASAAHRSGPLVEREAVRQETAPRTLVCREPSGSLTTYPTSTLLAGVTGRLRCPARGVFRFGGRLRCSTCIRRLLPAELGCCPADARVRRSRNHSGPCRRLPRSASRRAGSARPGRVRPVQVERPAGRTTWTGRTRSGCLRCAMGRRSGPGIPESPGSGGGAPAAEGPIRVVGPEALPAGGMLVPRESGCPNGWHGADP
jgi:hypothetical protein